MPKNYVSAAAAAKTLSRFFANKPNADKLTLEEIFVAVGRDKLDEQTNRNWLNNKMTQLRYHNFIKSVYTFDDRHKLSGIQLTLTGKKALGKVESDEGGSKQTSIYDQASESDKENISLNDVAKAVKAFQQGNPEFEVVFDVKFKGVQPTKEKV